ncbi:MAG: hypothetical protein JXB49_14140 [Bacteroidales bacterium]|nr:hypothetical protein [Bacteroidales bacterium]
MVTIVDFQKRKNSKGEEFNALVLQSGLELIKSHSSGRYYATAKRTTIPSTFDDAMCQSLIGTQIPGTVQRVECESYEFTVPDTGEILTLNHRWVYLKESEVLAAQVVAPEKVAMPL